MKRIRKSSPPGEYASWCMPTRDWKPSWAALDDDRSMRRVLVAALVKDQRGLCAYCNARITPQRGRYHVEHLLPRRLSKPDAPLDDIQSQAVERSGIPRERLDIDYRNLLACCPNQTGSRGSKGCGDYKSDRVLSLTPLQPQCEAAFRYGVNGGIESEQSEGVDAIRILGLGRPALQRARREALEGWLEVLDELLDELEGLPAQQLRARLEERLDDDPLPEFVVAARQLLLSTDD